MAVFGLVLAVPGAAFSVASVRLQLGLGIEAQARLLVVLFAGFFGGTLVAGPLADHIGLRPVLSGATFMVALGLVAFATATGAPWMAMSALVLGLGGASINTCANTLISSLYPERRAAMLTWLAVACAAGGMALPLAVLLGDGGWTMTLVSAAVVAVVTAVAMTWAEVPGEVHAFSWRGLGAVVGAPGFGWYLAALVCQGGNEAALAGWLTPYLTARGLPGSLALAALTLHWTGIIIGRFCMAMVVDRVGTRLTVIGGAVVASGGTMLLIGGRGPVVSVAAAAIAGVGISGVFSVVMADAGTRYSGRAGTMFGALLAAGQIGGMLIPWIVGAVAGRTSLGAGLAVVAGTTLAVAAIIGRPSGALAMSGLTLPDEPAVPQ